MVIGAAGSIGSAFVKQLVPYGPKSLHLVDISENNLVEVVRDLRSSLIELPDDFKTFAVAMGSDEFEKLLHSQKDYDYVVNFSALKHVRSEKDPYSLMRMYNTNVYYVKEMLDTLTGTKINKHFSVSSDKAANPANIMGATKIFMERILLAYSDRIPFSTARFANVAFSDGSLLHGFMQRLAKRQPFSAPYDVKRYFISHEEAGQLCLLSCFLGENRDIYFPKLNEDSDLLTFSEIAVQVLEASGFSPDICSSEDEAKQKAGLLNSDSKTWPCYFFASDTTGEKPFEEFYTDDDHVNMDRYRSVGVISQPPWKDQDAINLALEAFERIKKMDCWEKEDMVTAIKIIVPELMHEEKNKNLDQKM
ncbi:MAG: polysaccharide biosynthesis protein [Syntrophales bacterium]|nr:polysaccharide biosynthesis protein [Syntrophales bacterium]